MDSSQIVEQFYTYAILTIFTSELIFFLVKYFKTFVKNVYGSHDFVEISNLHSKLIFLFFHYWNNWGYNTINKLLIYNKIWGVKSIFDMFTYEKILLRRKITVLPFW